VGDPLECSFFGRAILTVCREFAMDIWVLFILFSPDWSLRILGKSLRMPWSAVGGGLKHALNPWVVLHTRTQLPATGHFSQFESAAANLVFFSQRLQCRSNLLGAYGFKDML
jgi:hypothetical protein